MHRDTRNFLPKHPDFTAISQTLVDVEGEKMIFVEWDFFDRHWVDDDDDNDDEVDGSDGVDGAGGSGGSVDGSDDGNSCDEVEQTDNERSPGDDDEDGKNFETFDEIILQSIENVGYVQPMGNFECL